MKKISLNKKTYLITAAAVFLILIISIYLKTTATNPVQIFNKGNQSAAEVLPSEKDNENENQAGAENKSLKKNQNSAKQETEIENIALVEQIKDPFTAARKQKKTKRAEVINKNTKSKDLILLEKNIIAETITGTENQADQKKEAEADTVQIKKEAAARDEKENDGAAAESNLNNIKLPFKLLGIIKNSRNASALFLYQGQNILKKEKDKIDLFQIKKINKNEIVLTYQKEELKLQVWEDEENEN
ncbi:MAG: hypothetical protein ACOCXB_01910 [Halanaerobium sp.]